MAATERALRALGTAFADHYTALLAKTVTRKPLIAVPVDPGTLHVSFRDRRRASTAELPTRFGLVYLYAGLVCDTVEDEASGRAHLRVTSYAFTLRSFGHAEPLFRWEFVRFPADDARWCRHHLQGEVQVELVDERGRVHAVHLNDWHLPTGWIALEEVVRFCIVDLGVRPLTDEWDTALRDSYELWHR